MRVAGHRPVAIAGALGISDAYARKILEERLSAIPIEDVEAVRKIELERLEKSTQRIEAYASKLVDGVFSKDAIELELKVADRRAKLLGLDAPSKLTLQHQLNPEAFANMTDEELEVWQALLSKLGTTPLLASKDNDADA